MLEKKGLQKSVGSKEYLCFHKGSKGSLLPAPSLLPGSWWGMSFPALHFWRNQEVPAVKKLWLFQSEQMCLLVLERKSMMFLKQCFARSSNHKLSYLHSCFLSKSGCWLFYVVLWPQLLFSLISHFWKGVQHTRVQLFHPLHRSLLCSTLSNSSASQVSPYTCFFYFCSSHLLTPRFLH